MKNEKAMASFRRTIEKMGLGWNEGPDGITITGTPNIEFVEDCEFIPARETDCEKLLIKITLKLASARRVRNAPTTKATGYETTIDEYGVAA